MGRAMSNEYTGRGLGPGRHRLPYDAGLGGGNSQAPYRHQARWAEKTSTRQGCDVNVISVKRVHEEENEEMPWERALYHVGW